MTKPTSKPTHRKSKSRLTRVCPRQKEIRFGTTFVFISMDEDDIYDDGTIEYLWTVEFRPPFKWWESGVPTNVHQDDWTQWGSEKTLAKAQVQSLRAAEKMWTKARKKMLSLVEREIKTLNKEALRLERDRIKILGMT